ncbi:hypothetical protein [Companilactobacillus pabuli]|uniref:Transposase n=1 Tax=Companilactobacillus pabuli TaxID=2714036 RepID=A0A7L7KUY3_9LACO|nr:hypothetical protein [Companilactobacillus pabuli]AKP02251.1 hypothetical protein ABB45_00580 [Companilactobacillus farciminis]AKS50548.1 hypothetical protein ABB44_00580 [Companilactobacillus farciminis]MDG5113648.1 transposase [Companilactobacillus pabuli]QMT83631.1 transposase [Companilactobacillus pabuli]GAQ02021.1 hypothetical protein NBRC111452_1837 [Companilactobacillus farciminis]
MPTSEEIYQEMQKYNEKELEIIRKDPWIIPATVAWMAIPAAICIRGFWKNRQLKTQLKIEREKTKRASLRLSEPKKIRPFHNC